jgi:hypothetical protein
MIAWSDGVEIAAVQVAYPAYYIAVAITINRKLREISGYVRSPALGGPFPSTGTLRGEYKYS